MKIGIIASMDAELEYVKNRLEDYSSKTVGKTLFHMGRLQNNEIIMCKCMTGKVFMAMTAQKMLDCFDGIEIVINCGVAGGLKDDIRIGDVVVAVKTVQHDMDVRGLGHELGEIPDINVKFMDADRKFLSAAESLSGYDFSVFFGNIVTGDVFVENRELKNELIRNFDGYCTDMETGSLAQVCLMNDVGFAGIRGMSDGADADASGDFLENIKKGSDNCAEVLVDIIRNL